MATFKRLFLSAMLLALLLAGLPELASLPSVRQWICSSLLPGSQAESLDLDWFGEQKLRGLSTKEGLQVESLVLKDPLWKLLLWRGKFSAASLSNALFAPSRDERLEVQTASLALGENSVLIDLKGSSLSEGRQEPFEAHLLLDRELLIPKGPSQASFRRFPLALLKPLLPRQTDSLLLESIGPLADLELEIKGQTGRLSFSSERLKLPETRFQTGSSLLLLEPVHLSYLPGGTAPPLDLLIERLSLKGPRDLSMRAVASLSHPALSEASLSFEASSPSTVRLHLETALRQGEGSARLSMDSSTSLYELFHSPLRLQGSLLAEGEAAGRSLGPLSLSWTLKKEEGLVGMEFFGEGQAQVAAFQWMQQGRFRGSFKNSLSIEGEFQEKSLSLRGRLEELLLAALPDATPPPTLLGERLSGIFSLDWRPLRLHLSADLKGSEGSLSFDAALDQNLLTLNSPLKAELSLERALSAYLQPDDTPFFSLSAGSGQRVLIEVDKEGFALPLNSFDWSGLSLGRMKIDPGKLEVNYSGGVKKLLKPLKIEPDRGGLVSLWFTPLYLSFSEGVATLERVDFLVASKYPMALWGRVHLPKDKIRMTLGLGRETIKKALGITGSPKGYLFQIPLKGTLSKIRADVKKAARGMPHLLAKSQGGPHGLLLQGLSDLFHTQKKPPKPTTKPFPWKTKSG